MESLPKLLVRAPGKLVLMGEYAVLDGAPALVLAVGQGVRCEVFADEAAAFQVETPAGDDRFVRAALLAVAAPAARYRFSADYSLSLAGKPGFGGSAAATVAAVLAGGGCGAEAYFIHRQVQGGGSGIDVAASLHGGLVHVTPDRPHPRVAAHPPLVPVVIYSGQGASTMPRVRAYQAWHRGRDAFVEQMAALVDVFHEDPVGTTRAARAILVEMAQRVGFDYETPALAAIAGLAERAGGGAKPSGAGGGTAPSPFSGGQSSGSVSWRPVRQRAFPLST